MGSGMGTYFCINKIVVQILIEYYWMTDRSLQHVIIFIPGHSLSFYFIYGSSKITLQLVDYVFG
jgi:hypothetical protein